MLFLIFMAIVALWMPLAGLAALMLFEIIIEPEPHKDLTNLQSMLGYEHEQTKQIQKEVQHASGILRVRGDNLFSARTYAAQETVATV